MKKETKDKVITVCFVIFFVGFISLIFIDANPHLFEQQTVINETVQQTNNNQNISESIQNTQRQKSYDQYGKNDKIPWEMFQSAIQDYINSVDYEKRYDGVDGYYPSLAKADEIFQLLTEKGALSKDDYKYLILIRVDIKYIDEYLNKKSSLNYKMYADMFKEAASIIRQFKKISISVGKYSELQNVHNKAINFLNNLK